MAANGVQSDTTSRIVARLVVYYVVLIGGGTLMWSLLPRAGAFAPTSLDALFGGGPPVTSRGAAVTPLDEVTLAITVAVAMLASVLLSMPVAWVYLTGYAAPDGTIQFRDDVYGLDTPAAPTAPAQPATPATPDVAVTSSITPRPTGAPRSATEPKISGRPLATPGLTVR